MKVVWYKVKVILVILIGLHTFSLPGYTQQQSDLVTASAEVIVRASTTFLLDGTDPGWGMKSTETINLGMVDSRGTPIAGVQSGHPDVNGIVGIPVNYGGSPI